MDLRGRVAYRLAISLALVAALLLIWLSLGVGIIGKDGDPANRMYFCVLVIGTLGALMARIQPLGMSRTLLAMALVQAIITAIALITGLGQPWSGPLELVLLNGFFVTLFIAAARLFKRAAQFIR